MTRDWGMGTWDWGLCHGEVLGAKARVLGIVATSFLAVACAKAPARTAPATPPPPGPAPADLARVWDAEHVSALLSPLVDHVEVVKRLAELQRASPDLYAIEAIGQSLEGRTVERGPESPAQNITGLTRRKVQGLLRPEVDSQGQEIKGHDCSLTGL